MNIVLRPPSRLRCANVLLHCLVDRDSLFKVTDASWGCSADSGQVVHEVWEADHSRTPKQLKGAIGGPSRIVAVHPQLGSNLGPLAAEYRGET
jgi:hypothetical protein